MAHLKTIGIGGNKFSIAVSADGEFYANVPEHFGDVLRGYLPTKAGGCVKVQANTLEALERTLREAVAAYDAPEETTELVIAYNIQSRVSFWLGEDGEIYPNGYHARIKSAGGKWANGDQFGNHHATNPAEEGYSLTVGAEALEKTTKTYRTGKTEVSYKKYYGENGDHLGGTTPAEKLNGWCGLSLPKNAKEIPYSDEAALFFHDLMMGMAKISKMIQERTANQNDLMALIMSGNHLLQHTEEQQ
jgi:hypothetical protein